VQFWVLFNNLCLLRFCDVSPESRDIGARIVSRQRRVIHLGNNWGRLLRYNAFAWKRSVATEPLDKVFTIGSSKNLFKEDSRERVSPQSPESENINQRTRQCSDSHQLGNQFLAGKQPKTVLYLAVCYGNLVIVVTQSCYMC
jgi:hypothetical protein